MPRKGVVCRHDFNIIPLISYDEYYIIHKMRKSAVCMITLLVLLDIHKSYFKGTSKTKKHFQSRFKDSAA